MSGKKAPVNKQPGSLYEKAVLEEQLLKFIVDLQSFRNIGQSLMERLDPELIGPLDACYQSMLDNVLNSILNCNDMKLSSQVMKGLENHMKKRGNLI